MFEGAGIISQAPLRTVRWVAMALRRGVQPVAPLRRVPSWWGTRVGTMLPIGASQVGGSACHLTKLITQPSGVVPRSWQGHCWRMAQGRRRQNGKWQMAGSKWQWQMANGKWQVTKLVMVRWAWGKWQIVNNK